MAGNVYEINLAEESSGTKKLFGLLPFIADSLTKGITLVIDELDAKIHPLLLKHIIMLYNNFEINKHGAQLAAKYREQYPRRTAMLDELRNF